MARRRGWWSGGGWGGGRRGRRDDNWYASTAKKKNKKLRSTKNPNTSYWLQMLNHLQSAFGDPARDMLSETVSQASRLVMGDLSMNDQEDELDMEVYFGSLHGEIVGVRYYHGTVNNGEMVSLVREPNNRYDPNAVQVTNMGNAQVGHIKRELARPLAFIMDNSLARIEASVPSGANNTFKMPVELMFYGRPENRQETIEKLKYYGFFLTGGSNILTGAGSSGDRLSLSAALGNRTTALSQAQMKDELDKMFEKIEQSDISKTLDPTEAICTPLFPHQKQALHWMTEREKGNMLPPFWEDRGNGTYFNTVTKYTDKDKPKCVRGGILADDMGLGKTLEIIALILTNFVDGQPLARPVPGRVRSSKLEKKHRLEGFKKKHAERKGATDKKSFRYHTKLEIKPFIDDAESGKKEDVTLMEDEEEEYSGSSESEDEEEKEEGVCGDIVAVEAADDPEFAPKISNEPMLTSPNVKSRPRRNAKRPSKYVFSSDDDDDDVDRSQERPAKKARTKLYETKVPPNTSYKGKGKGKGKSSQKQKTAIKLEIKSESASSDIKVGVLPPLPDLPPIVLDDSDDELPDLAPTPSKSRGPADATPSSRPEGPGKPGTGTGSSPIVLSDTELPDISMDDTAILSPELPDISMDDTAILSPGSSRCGKSTGRTVCSKGSRATLIICPLSVLSNWINQFEIHVNENVHLEIYTYYGPRRSLDPELLAKQDVVLTTYSTIAADHSKRTRPLHDVRWLRVVIDEGHIIRNPNTQQTKAVLDLKTERKWVVSGTPIQNSLKDLWTLIKFLGISPFTNREWWLRCIEKPIGRGDQSAFKRVQALMGNVALRRHKLQKVDGKPLVELPKKEICIEHVTLSEEERKTYDVMAKEGRIIVSKYFQQGTLLRNYGQVLAILMRLRQLCCHPFLIAKAAKEAGIEENQLPAQAGQSGVDGLSEEVRKKLIDSLLSVLNSGSDEECSICLDPLRLPVITPCVHAYCKPCIEAVIRNEQPNARCPLCRGEISQEKLVEVPPEQASDAEQRVEEALEGAWHSSAKVDALMNGLLTLRAEDPTIKSMVVSQFTSFLTVIETPLRQNGFNVVRFDGTMSAKRRQIAMEVFSDTSPQSPTVMLLSLKAGGVGINLVAASRVFLMDPAWNPATEEQCFDRCHRLGQTRDVHVTKYIVDDSVEERMMALQEKKRDLMKGAFGKKQTAEERQRQRINDIKILMDL